MNIQWYPGHMVKAKKIIQENLKLVDAVVEIVDARIPNSSRNPDINSLVKAKPRLIALNKVDLADGKVTNNWINYFVNEGFTAVGINAQTGVGINRLIELIKKVTASRLVAASHKGRNPRPPRLMIVGIPNVGKSSLLNKLTGKASAHTGNIPGITKGKQWVRIRGNIELLDTPGVLWPKFDDPQVGFALAVTGAISDDVYDHAYVVKQLIDFLLEKSYLGFLSRFQLAAMPPSKQDFFKIVGQKRGFILSGGRIDYEKVYLNILQEFRKGLFGRISLETPKTVEDRRDEINE